jgi:phospholipid-binding lipoprotein MlaA
MINTTWGVLGFGDLFAGNPEAKTPDADLGLALARHGVGNGIYLVWPFLGPSTLRDTVGWVGGLPLDPIGYVQPLEASLGVRAYSEVNATSFRIGDYESLKDAAIDPYLAVRDAYLQNRASKAGR